MSRTHTYQPGRVHRGGRAKQRRRLMELATAVIVLGVILAAVLLFG